jgi:ferredoxin--NADP+ reductase
MTVSLADNATLVERIDLNATLAIFRIRPDVVPPPAAPWFDPGQYITIGLEGVQRAYSIASDPGERRWLEFYVRYARDPATGTPLTHHLFKLPVGARISLGGKIAGRFTLERTQAPGDTRSILLVAAGTGVAPFVSMVRHARRRADAATLSRLALLHGVSHPDELAYRPELEDAARESGLRYLPTISRPSEHPDWTGPTGRVESLLDEARLNGDARALGLGGGTLRPDRVAIYVCGFRGTLASTLKNLVGRGFAPEERKLRRLIGIPNAASASLFFEQYDLEPIFDPSDTATLEFLRAAARPVN